jgi:hypothetical protein
MDQRLLKSHLRTLYDQLRNQQEWIGRLRETQQAMLETLSSQLPDFESSFELERLNKDIAQEKQENERTLQLIDAQIQELSEAED